MSGHVDGMRAGGRNLAIVVRSRQPIRGHRRIVAGVNDVVDDARIIRIFREERNQHRHRLVFVGLAGVVRSLRRQQRERVEGAGVDISGYCSYSLPIAAE